MADSRGPHILHELPAESGEHDLWPNVVIGSIRSSSIEVKSGVTVLARNIEKTASRSTRLESGDAGLTA